MGKMLLITGKGGVGKTLYSHALCLKLKEANESVLLNQFLGGDYHLSEALNLTTLNRSFSESVELYIAKKIGNQVISKWISKTPFFTSLLKVIPGLTYIIVFGHLIDYVRKNNSSLVIDSPATGHLITLLDSVNNFKQIFSSGPIYDDLIKIKEFILDKQLFEVHVLALPTKMAIDEGQELIESVKGYQVSNTKFILNDSWPKMIESNQELKDEIKKTDFPNYINQKLQAQNNILDTGNINFDRVIPHIAELEKIDIIKKMSKFI